MNVYTCDNIVKSCRCIRAPKLAANGYGIYVILWYLRNYMCGGVVVCSLALFGHGSYRIVRSTYSSLEQRKISTIISYHIISTEYVQ